MTSPCNMADSLAYGIVVLLCLCCSVDANGSNTTYLFANCSSKGGCDFDFVIGQTAVEAVNINELRTVANNVTQIMPIVGRTILNLINTLTDEENSATGLETRAKISYYGSMDRLNKTNAGVNDGMGKLQQAADAIMNAALCFQSADPNVNCGALIPDYLT